MTSKVTQDLANTLLAAKEAYYAGEPQMSDSEFDALEDQLRAVDPTNPYFDKVGAPVMDGKKVKHVVPMLSMQKANSMDDIMAWIRRTNWGNYGKLFLVEPKVDGNSVDLKYSNGKLAAATTRGDGAEGFDITRIAKLIPSIPKTIAEKQTFHVRGELYLPKNTSYPNPEKKPLRNIVAGLLNPKRKDISDAKHIKFVACRVLAPAKAEFAGGTIMSESTSLEWLCHIGFPTINRHKVLLADQIQTLWQEHNEGNRHNYEFELDGLVIVIDNWAVQQMQPNKNDHHLDIHIAYKFANEYKQTTLRGVTWQMSRHGNLIPVANFDAVTIGGTTIRNAGLSNAETVKGMQLEPGDQIEVTRANDIIPFVSRSIKSKRKAQLESSLIPTQCPYCSTTLVWEGVHKHCPNTTGCEEQQLQRIVHWVVNCEMDGVSEQTLRTLWQYKYVRSIEDLYKLQQFSNDLYAIDGWGESRIENLLSQIDKSHKMTTFEFIERLGIPSVGAKAAKKLGLTSVQKLLHFQSDGSAKGEAVSDWMAVIDNHNLVARLSNLLVISDVVEKKGLRVCATGKAPMERKHLIALLEQHGYVWSDTVDKDLHLLLCDNPDSGTTKNKKAVKLGVAVKTYAEFLPTLK